MERISSNKAVVPACSSSDYLACPVAGALESALCTRGELVTQPRYLRAEKWIGLPTPLQILHGYFSILDVSVCLNINLKLINQRLKVGCRESTVLLWRLQGGRQPGIIYSLSFSIVPWPRTVDALIRDSPPALIKADEDAKIQPSATCSNGGSNDLARHKHKDLCCLDFGGHHCGTMADLGNHKQFQSFFLCRLALLRLWSLAMSQCTKSVLLWPTTLASSTRKPGKLVTCYSACIS